MVVNDKTLTGTPEISHTQEKITRALWCVRYVQGFANEMARRHLKQLLMAGVTTMHEVPVHSRKLFIQMAIADLVSVVGQDNFSDDDPYLLGSWSAEYYWE